MLPTGLDNSQIIALIDSLAVHLEYRPPKKDALSSAPYQPDYLKKRGSTDADYCTEKFGVRVAEVFSALST